jgi:hypothetical protein
MTPNTEITTQYELVESTTINRSYYPSDNYEMFMDGVTEITMTVNGIPTICTVIYPKEFTNPELLELAEFTEEYRQ